MMQEFGREFIRRLSANGTETNGCVEFFLPWTNHILHFVLETRKRHDGKTSYSFTKYFAPLDAAFRYRSCRGFHPNEEVVLLMQAIFLIHNNFCCSFALHKYNFGCYCNHKPKVFLDSLTLLWLVCICIVCIGVGETQNIPSKKHYNTFLNWFHRLISFFKPWEWSNLKVKSSRKTPRSTITCASCTLRSRTITAQTEPNLGRTFPTSRETAYQTCNRNRNRIHYLNLISIGSCRVV